MNFANMLEKATEQRLVTWVVKERQEWCGEMCPTIMKAQIPQTDISVTLRRHILRDWHDPQFSVEIASGTEKTVIASTKKLAKSLGGTYNWSLPLSLFVSAEISVKEFEERNSLSIAGRLNKRLHDMLYRKE